MPVSVQGKHVLQDVTLAVNGAVLDNWVESVTFEVNIDGQAAAGMGEVQSYDMPGVQSVSDPVATFYQDYAAAKTYQTLLTLWQNRTVVNIVGKASSGAKAPTNPEWTIPVFVKKMPLMTGTRGQRHMAPVTFGVAGTLSIATA